MKKEFLQDKNGKPSLMRYIVLFGARMGAIISSLSFIMLCISYFKNSPDWAPFFMTLCLSGLAEIGGAITGKAIQKKHEV